MSPWRCGGAVRQCRWVARMPLRQMPLMYSSLNATEIHRQLDRRRVMSEYDQRSKSTLLQMKLPLSRSEEIYYPMRQLKDILLHRNCAEKVEYQSYCDELLLSKEVCMSPCLSQPF